MPLSGEFDVSCRGLVESPRGRILGFRNSCGQICNLRMLHFDITCKSSEMHLQRGDALSIFHYDGTELRKGGSV